MWQGACGGRLRLQYLPMRQHEKRLHVEFLRDCDRFVLEFGGRHIDLAGKSDQVGLALRRDVITLGNRSQAHCDFF